MLAVRAAALALLGIALVAGRALAADASDLKDKKEKALAAATGDASALERAQAIADLAAVDTADAARALAECVSLVAAAQTKADAAHAKTLKDYEPYAGFTMKDKKDWEKKADFLDRLEKEDERIQGLGVVAQASLAAIAKMKDAAALTVLERAGADESDARGRYVFFSGLLSNPAAKAESIAKRALADPAPMVRLGAYEAMGARKDPALLEVLAQGLKETGWPARKLVVRALELTNDVRAVPFLVTGMQLEFGALLEDFARALRTLTGEKHGTDAETWLRWYNDHKDDLAQKGAAAVNPKGGARPSAATDYYGVQTVSKRILFVIDISGSMKEPIGTEAVEQTGVARKDQLSGPKIEVAKNVLVDAVHKLDKTTSFNIIFFNHQISVFQDKMVLATDEMKVKVDNAVADLRPLGSTWAYGALRKAFDFAGVSAAPVAGKFDPQVDTIFFLSDGAPTDEDISDAKLMEPRVILDAVREWNRLAHIRIHTIALDPQIGGGTLVRFMKTLAAENGGTYTGIGATK